MVFSRKKIYNGKRAVDPTSVKFYNEDETRRTTDKELFDRDFRPFTGISQKTMADNLAVSIPLRNL